MIQNWTKNNILNSLLIIYSDGSKLENRNGTGIYHLNSKNSYTFNIGNNQEIFDSELFGIYKALEIAKNNINPFILEIWIFSDSQSVLKGLKINQKTRNHFIYAEIYKISKEFNTKNISININWSPGHINIFRNQKADKAARYTAEYIEPHDIGSSISFIKRKLKEKSLLEWNLDWQKHKTKQERESLFEKYNNINFK